MHTYTLILTVGVSLGIILGERFLYSSEIAVATFLLSVVQLLLWCFSKKFLRKQKSQDVVLRGTIPLYIFIVCFGITLGILRIQFHDEKKSFVCDTPCTFAAEIISSPKVHDMTQRITVRPKGEKEIYDVSITAPLYPRYQKGDELFLTGKVTVPKSSMQHSDSSMFNYSSYLRTHGIGSQMLFPHTVQVSRSSSTSFTTTLDAFRESMSHVLQEYIREPSRALAEGMVFGNDSMSSDSVATFRVAGLSHIVVLSGFNIAILISFIFVVLFFVPLTLRIGFALFFVLSFDYMVGAESSVMRATVMAFISLTALLMGRGYVARQGLVLSLLGIVLYDPLDLLYDVSLHLSFLATAGIVYLSDSVKHLVQKIPSAMYREIFSTSLCAYLATLPYVVFTFGTLSVYALIANIMVLPLVPLMMLGALFVIVMSSFSTVLATVTGFIVTTIGNVIFFVARSVESLPFSSVSVDITFPTLCFMYCILIGVYLFFTRKKYNETSITKDGEMVSEIISY